MVCICRLIAEKINKNERKNLAEIINIICGLEPDDFWEKLGSKLEKGKIKVITMLQQYVVTYFSFPSTKSNKYNRAR